MNEEEARLQAAALADAGARLRECPHQRIVSALAATCARFADSGNPVRRDAEAALAEHYGAPPAAVRPIFDAAFPRWDDAAIEAWLEAELARPEALDGFVELAGAFRRARGPALLLAIQARGVPTTPIVDLMAALLVKAPVWIKPASGADDLVARFAAALGEEDPALGEAVAVAGWERGSSAAWVAIDAAELVSATGGAETVEAMRRAAGAATRVVVHGPRLSAVAIAEEALEEDMDGVVAGLADDTAFAGQTGCLSPVVAWIEAPAARVHALVEPLLDACAARWPGRTRREAETAERSAWAEWTALAAVEEAAGTGGATAGGVDAGWTVRSRSRPEPPAPPPVPRALLLEPVETLEEVAALCDRRRGLVATVGVAAPDARGEALARRLSAADVERIAPLGAMQRPPLTWRRDGRPGLGDLVEWTDWERGSSTRSASR